MSEKKTLFRTPLVLRNKKIVLKNTPVELHLFRDDDHQGTRVIELTMFDETFTVCQAKNNANAQKTYEDLIKALSDEKKALQMSPSDGTSADIEITL